MFEIVAPAGDIKSMAAAVLAGADAVYFGFKGMNARGRAGNFDKTTILKAIEYLRKTEIKSYITLNTLVFEEELEGLEHRLNLLSLNPPDAIIFQDMAVLELGKQILPDTEFHFSTQAGICNLDGLEMAGKLGVSRAVVARELSFNELKYLAQHSPVEMEVFVFGAMCYSVSGYCYASLKEKGTSSNRGVCAQLCRLRHNGQPSFSMKDLNLIHHIKDLTQAGLNVFKIEGRMKGADYVFNVVSAFRLLKDEQCSPDSLKEAELILQNSFLRDTGPGYFSFPEGDIFSKKQHSLEKIIGNVVSIHKNSLSVMYDGEYRLKKGDRVKILGEGATVTGHGKNTVILSRPLKGYPGTQVRLYPDRDSVKGLQGIVNEIEKISVPLIVDGEFRIKESVFNINVFWRGQPLLELTLDIDSETAREEGVTESLIRRRLSSPLFSFDKVYINDNRLVVRHSVFKLIKRTLSDEIKMFSPKWFTSLSEKYSVFEYEEIQDGWIEDFPVVYSSLKECSDKPIRVVNNISGFKQLPERKSRIIVGSLLPVTNRVSAHAYRKMGAEGYLKPYELESNNAPYFIVRKLPDPVPNGFSFKKKGDVYFIFKEI